MDQDKQAANFRLELPHDVIAIYSNISRISYTPFDFVLDFSQVLPGKIRHDILARVVLSPAGAKLFLRAMAENVARYEAQFGEITLPKSDTGLANDLFGRVKPPEGEAPPDAPDAPEGGE